MGLAVTIVFGMQWGDEGKGRTVDLLARDADYVVRYSGGANAGHTVVVGNERYALRLVPSGILYPDKWCFMGGGTAIDPLSLVAEMDGLIARGVDFSHFRVSGSAHVVMPYHKLLERLDEERLGKSRIGTTATAQGPTYADRSARWGITMWDLMERDRLTQRVESALQVKNPVFQHAFGHEPLKTDDVVNEVWPAAERLRPYVAQIELTLAQAAKEGKRILMEGAQGAFLDLGYGTYPYVTSSHPVPGGACLGTGIGPRHIERVIGVAKAYTSRVGAGPFPTEQDNETGEHLRERGHEYGTVTGRPRRCGWLDLVMLRTAALINGVDALAVARLDILDELAPLLVCTHYRCDGQDLRYVPSDIRVLERCQPVYEQLPGWRTSTQEARHFSQLPPPAEAYLDLIARETGTPIAVVGVGERREQAIVQPGALA